MNYSLIKFESTVIYVDFPSVRIKPWDPISVFSTFWPILHACPTYNNSVIVPSDTTGHRSHLSDIREVNFPKHRLVLCRLIWLENFPCTFPFA